MLISIFNRAQSQPVSPLHENPTQQRNILSVNCGIHAANSQSPVTTYTLNMFKPNKAHLSVRREISRTVSATKNLRAISRALVEKVRANDGVSSTQVANQLSEEAISDVTATVADVSSEEIAAIERNIRRRLYDSLKVLVSIGAIRRCPRDKSLSWVGVRHLVPQLFQHCSSSLSQSPAPRTDPEPFRVAIEHHRQHIIAKTNELSQIRAHFNALHTLFLRNENNPAPNHHRLDFPFVVIRTHVSTHIRLHSTPARDNLKFTFAGAYELVNDSGILDRLFVVGNGPPLRKLISHPSHLSLDPTHPTSEPLQHTPPAQPRPHNTLDPAAARQETLGSPERQPVGSTLFHFAKFTSGRTPALSPGASQYHVDSPDQNAPLQSPLLNDCLRMLGGEPLRPGTIVNQQPIVGSPQALPSAVPNDTQPREHAFGLDLSGDYLFGNPNMGRVTVGATQGCDLAGERQ